jgi:sec-independent protein translocase protein TatA
MFLALLGAEDVLVILVLAVLLFGAEKAPEMSRQIGRARAQLQRVQTQVREAILTDEERALEQRLKFEAARDLHVAQQDVEAFQLRRAAEELGIDPTGKPKEALRAEIARRVAEPAEREE